MLFILSPAKTLDFSPSSINLPLTHFRFMAEAESLISQLRQLSADDLRSLMGISPQLAQLNYERFRDWSVPSIDNGAKAALLAFRGDVYTGLQADTLTDSAMYYASSNIRILSGLYGLLRPTDLIQPYRLEMGTAFANENGRNLYQFWGSKITEMLKKDIAENGGILVNLASQEYYKSVQPKSLGATIITPEFKDEKNGVYKVISFYAKKARGMMCRYAADNNITQPEDLKSFDVEGYFFDQSESTDTNWIFKRFERNSLQ